jgi:hypothetical protein
MKPLAVGSFIVGAAALFVVADWHWGLALVRVFGPVAEIHIAAWALWVGLIASPMAAIFASIAARRTKPAGGRRLFLGSCAVLLGLLSVVVALMT